MSEHLIDYFHINAGSMGSSPRMSRSEENLQQSYVTVKRLQSLGGVEGPGLL